MEGKYIIELRVLTPESMTGDDTTGYVRKAGGDQQEYLALRPVILLTPAIVQGFNPQPDPPVTVQPRDVQGFMNNQEYYTPNDETGSKPAGDHFGGLIIIGKFLTNPVGTFYSAVTNTRP